MGDERDYQKLLKKMYLIELLGDSLYGKLALNEKDTELRKIYVRLSDNERETGKNIEKEINLKISNHPKPRHQFIVKIFSVIFSITPNKILSKVLRNILKKRIYSQWSEMYTERNPELWRLLVEHEKLQHEVLSPYWNK